MTSKGTDTSQSVSLVPQTTPQDPEGNKQPAGRGAPSTTPSDGTEKHTSGPEGKTSPKDSEGKIHPVVRDQQSTVPNEGTESTHSVTEGTQGAQDSGGILQPTDMAPKT